MNEKIIELYSQKKEDNFIVNLISRGELSSDKKKIASKSAASIYDQSIGKYFFDKIKSFDIIEKFEIFYFSANGNKFLIILMPEEYSVKIVEFMGNKLSIDSFDENNKLKGQKPNCAGASWANLNIINKYLFDMKVQASYLSLRLIEDYDFSLGVSFLRRLIKVTMKNKRGEFDSREELLKFLKSDYRSFYDNLVKNNFFEEGKKIKKVTDFFK